MNDEEKKAVKYFYNLRATIDESNMLFDEEINVKHGKETIKQITIILNLIKKLEENCKKCIIRDELDEYINNSISVQKVKDKIEYLDNQQKQWLEDRELKESDREIIFARDILQELIEKKEN